RPCIMAPSENSSGYQRSEKPRHTNRFSESLKLMITTTRIGRYRKTYPIQSAIRMPRGRRTVRGRAVGSISRSTVVGGFTLASGIARSRREAARDGRRDDDDQHEQDRQDERERRAERPVASLEELIAHEIADHDRLASADELGDDEVRHGRD